MTERKFKVGDRVRVKGLVDYSRPSKEQYVGGIFIIDNILKGHCHGGPDWCYHLDGTGCNWCDGELEFADVKDILKNGMVVENRGGDREIVLGTRMVDDEGFHDMSLYRDDLTHRVNGNADIVKVYTVKDVCTIEDVFKDRYLTLIWEREEEEPVKEMTVAEIEEKLGYKVKVIADKE